MTVSNTSDSEAMPVADTAIVGLSPSRLALARFRRDKVAVIAFFVVCFFTT